MPEYIFSDAAGRARAVGLVSNLPTDKRWRIEWREVSERRRDAQNRLLWRWNNEIQAHMLEYFGQLASAEEWHEVLCRKLMPAELSSAKLPTGECAEVGRWRSSKATVKQMADYLTKLDGYCAESLWLLLSHSSDDFHLAMMQR